MTKEKKEQYTGRVFKLPVNKSKETEREIARIEQAYCEELTAIYNERRRKEIQAEKKFKDIVYRS